MRIPPAALLLACLVWAAGCSKPPPPTPVPAKGKVVFADGKPVTGMILSLHPDDEATKSGRLHTVALPGDGSFSIECLPGRYKATLSAIPKSAGGAAADGPGPASDPVALSGTKTTPKTLTINPKAIMLARHADITSTPLSVEVPTGGASDLVLTVK